MRLPRPLPGVRSQHEQPGVRSPELMAANGKLPASALAPIAGGQLAKQAAAAWNAMNVEARKRGVELRPTGSKSSYRTYAQQVELYNLYLAGKGALAAVPGTSNHGLGVAVDVATQQMRSTIDSIGAKFGWAKRWSDAPSEWWHLKYKSGVWSGRDPGPTGTGGGGDEMGYPDWYWPWAIWYLTTERVTKKRPAGVPTTIPQWAWDGLKQIEKVGLRYGMTDGERKWIAWSLGGKKGPRPDVPTTIPERWWPDQEFAAAQRKL